MAAWTGLAEKIDSLILAGVTQCKIIIEKNGVERVPISEKTFFKKKKFFQKVETVPKRNGGERVPLFEKTFFFLKTIFHLFGLRSIPFLF